MYRSLCYTRWVVIEVHTWNKKKKKNMQTFFMTRNKNGNWKTAGREAFEEYTADLFTEGHSVYIGMASTLYCRKASILIVILSSSLQFLREVLISHLPADGCEDRFL